MTSKKGKMPSTSSISPTSTLLLPSRLLFLRTQTPNAFEILEELRVGIHHQQIMSILETSTIGFEAAVELVKFRVLPKSLSINLRCLSITFPTDLLRIAISFC